MAGRRPCRTGRAADPGQDVLQGELQRTRHTLEDVRARIGKETDRADGLLAAGLEIAPQALGDLGSSGGVAPTKSALLALLGEPASELHPLLRLVHTSQRAGSRRLSPAGQRVTGDAGRFGLQAPVTGLVPLYVRRPYRGRTDESSSARRGLD